VGEALGLIGEIEGDRPEGRTVETLGRWLEMNALRSLVADLPAWGCYLVGFLVSLEVGV